MLKMIVNGKAWNGRTAFNEVLQPIKGKAEGFHYLRMSLGYIKHQTDEEYLRSLHLMGITVTFEEV
jgi:hypothetical protein